MPQVLVRTKAHGTFQINTSQFTIDSHELTRPQIPMHRHGMNHGHKAYTLTDCTFSFASNSETFSIGGGDHTHQIDPSQWNHSHNLKGGGTDDDTGPRPPGGDSGQTFDDRGYSGNNRPIEVHNFGTNYFLTKAIAGKDLIHILYLLIQEKF